MKMQVVNNHTNMKKGGIEMKGTTKAMTNGMQGELTQLTWHGGRQGDLDGGTWHGGRQGDLDGGTWHGGRQGDLDGGTWHGGRQGDLDGGTWHGGRQGDLDGGTWHCEACSVLWDKVIQYRVDHNMPVNQEGDDNFFVVLGEGLAAIKEEERRIADSLQRGRASPA